jgi:hypothetical protein
LSGIPPRFKQHGLQLLSAFNNRGNELTWNSNGTLFINQTAIPKSNVFEIFPILYKVKKPLKAIPGLLECISQINQMGLGEFIVQKNSKNTVASKFVKPESIKSESSQSLPHWWYIGP